MAKWNFLLIRQFGRRHQRRYTCQRIKSQVQLQGETGTFPFVKYELGNQQEYYLGLAVNPSHFSTEAEVQEKAKQILSTAGIISPQIIYPVDSEQVVGFLRGTYECESFTVPIRYEAGSNECKPDINQLLIAIDPEELHESQIRLADLGPFERLLYWCSAVGGGDLPRFQQACQLLKISLEYGGAWSVVRRLTLLGHMEFSLKRSLLWGMLPPTLVEPISQNHKCFLVGQRTPMLLEKIGSICPINEEFQRGAPHLIQVECEPGTASIEISPGFKITSAGCVSEKMKRQLPSLDEWKKQLPPWQEKDFGRYDIERYIPEHNDFQKMEYSNGFQEGLYRFTFDTNRPIQTIAYYNPGEDSWICGDFYGLRFIDRNRSKITRAAYEPEKEKLLIPLADRWPMPYERAIILASGRLPLQKYDLGNQVILEYTGITEPFAQEMCNLLNTPIQVSS